MSDQINHENEERLPAVRIDHDLVPNDPSDDVEITKGAITRGQEALNSLLEALP